MSLCDHCPGQASAGGAMQPCTLLLRSPLSGQCCRLLQAGKEVLWHGERDLYLWFDGKGGVKAVSYEQASMVGFLLSGTDAACKSGPQ